MLTRASEGRAPERRGSEVEPRGGSAEVLGESLRGGAEKAREAGIDLVGGHTIKSEGPIYGLAVTGIVHPDRIVSNAGGRPGDRLVLTKLIGTGIVITANNDEDVRGAIAEAIVVMSTLDRAGAEAYVQQGIAVAPDRVEPVGRILAR